MFSLHRLISLSEKTYKTETQMFHENHLLKVH